MELFPGVAGTDAMAMLQCLLEGQRRIERRLNEFTHRQFSRKASETSDRAFSPREISTPCRSPTSRAAASRAVSFAVSGASCGKLQTMPSLSQVRQAAASREEESPMGVRDTDLDSQESKLSAPDSMSNWVLPKGWPGTINLRKMGRSDATLDSTGVQMLQVDSNGTMGSRMGCRGAACDLEGAAEALAQDDRWRKVYTLDPHSTHRIAFDTCSLVVLLYDLIGLPVLLAWDIPIQGALKVLSVGTLVFWTADMVLNFGTGYITNGVLVRDRWRIAQNYARTWMLPDLFIIVCNLVSMIMLELHEEKEHVSNSESIRFLRFSKSVRLARIAGMMRLFRVVHVLHRFADRRFLQCSQFIEAPCLLFLVLLTHHWLACIWIALGRTAPSDTGWHWLFTKVNGPDSKMIGESDRWYQYSTALHWSLTNMTPASMQVHALNTVERFYTVFCLILGVMVFSSILSTLSARFMQYNLRRQEADSKIRTLERFLSRAGVRRATAVAVHRQVRQRMQQTLDPSIAEVPVLSLLSERMQRQLHYELRADCLDHPLLRWWEAVDEEGVQHLCHEATESHALASGDTLFHQCVEAVAVYRVSRGSLRYMQDPRTAKVPESVEEVALEGEWLCEAAFWTKWIHVGTAEAAECSTLVWFRPEKVQAVLEQRRVISHVFHEYAKAFHARLTSAGPPSTDWPTDLRIPFCAFEDIMVSFPVPIRELIAVPALKAMTTTKNRRRSKQNAALLRKEVRAGKCVVMLTGEGRVERFVSVAVLRLERQDGKVLVQLGELQGSAVQAACRLPGSKQRVNELPLDAINSLIFGLLSPLARAVLVTESSCESTQMNSTRSHGLRTLYTRIVHRAELGESLDSLHLDDLHIDLKPTATCGASPVRRLSSLPDSAVIFAKPREMSDAAVAIAAHEDADLQAYNFILFAWLTPEEMDHFAKDDGQYMLQAHLSSIHWPREVLLNAVARCEGIDAEEGGTSLRLDL